LKGDRRGAKLSRFDSSSKKNGNEAPTMMPTKLHALTFALACFSTCCSESAEPPAKPAPQEQQVDKTVDPIEAIQQFIAAQKIDKTKEGWKERLPKPPKLTFDPTKDYFWVVETNVGSFTVKLLPDVAPMHVSSYLYLTKLGYWEGIKFHRVIQRFMAQGGDPTGTGRGGPGYRMDLELKAGVTHSKAGILSTANSGPNTDGSQFFLTFRATKSLDGGYTVVGEMTDGVETTLRELEKRGMADDPGTPSEPLFIRSAKIEVKAKG